MSNRVQKILEDSNVKLASVLADPFGVSGQLMLEALLEGKASADQIAELAKGRARRGFLNWLPPLRATG